MSIVKGTPKLEECKKCLKKKPHVEMAEKDICKLCANKIKPVLDVGNVNKNTKLNLNRIKSKE